MTYWWPKLREAEVPTPKTIAVDVEEAEIDDASDAEGGFTVWLPDMKAVVEAIEEVNGPPAFVRTDQMSAKHAMGEASRVTSLDIEHVAEHMWNITEHHEMAWMVPDPKQFYVREWLDLKSFFSAFQDCPIAPEIRWFILDGKVHDHGFYWPKDAIHSHGGLPDDWEDLWAKTKEIALSNAAWCEREYVSAVIDQFPEGYWSLDFALTEDAEWYAIDMARGEASFHPEGIEKARDSPFD